MTNFKEMDKEFNVQVEAANLDRELGLGDILSGGFNVRVESGEYDEDGNLIEKDEVEEEVIPTEEVIEREPSEEVKEEVTPTEEVIETDEVPEEEGVKVTEEDKNVGGGDTGLNYETASLADLAAEVTKECEEGIKILDNLPGTVDPDTLGIQLDQAQEEVKEELTETREKTEVVIEPVTGVVTEVNDPNDENASAGPGFNITGDDNLEIIEGETPTEE